MSTKSPISIGRFSSTPAKGARISVCASSIRARSSAACGGFQIGLGLGDLGLRLKALLAELLGGGGLDLAHRQRRLGLLDHGAPLARIEPDQDIPGRDRGAARRPRSRSTRPSVSARSVDDARRRGLAVDHDLALDRLGHHLAHPHARQASGIRCCSRAGRLRGGLAGVELPRREPARDRERDPGGDQVGGLDPHGSVAGQRQRFRRALAGLGDLAHAARPSARARRRARRRGRRGRSRRRSACPASATSRCSLRSRPPKAPNGRPSGR